jgi:hypothetical protein
MQATKALPQIDPHVVAACKERDPNFGKGGQASTGTQQSWAAISGQVMSALGRCCRKTSI